MLSVDGGYLTFKLAFGGFDSWQMKHGSNVSIFAVDNKPKRRELYKDYKKNRNVGKELVVEMVHELRDRVDQEKLLPLCSIEGLEADDIVACWNIFNPDDDIIGVDKDFFQLPNVDQVYYHSLKPYSFRDTVDKLPSFVQDLAIKDFALYQMLLGDVADTIPRLLAKGKAGKEQLYMIDTAIQRNQLSECLLSMFGYDIKRNAQLVLLPYFAYCEVADWFDTWCKGEYYQASNWTGLYQQIKDCTLKNKLADTSEMMELFSLV